MRHLTFTALAALGLLAACQEPMEPNAELSAARRAVRSIVITDLGVGARSEAYGISPNGLIVGSSADEVNGSGRAVIWEHEVIRYLADNGDYGEARGVSPRGVAVGWNFFHAVLWKNGVTTDLGVLPGGDFSVANAINPSGVIVGLSDTSQAPGGGDETAHAVMWKGGVITDLGTLPGASGSEATAINAAGDIVGFSVGFGSRKSAILWRRGTMTDLGALEGSGYSQAYGINASGQVVGLGSSGAVLWDHGRVVHLNGMTEARAISPSGEIVGTHIDFARLVTRAVLWRRGVITQLGTLPGGDYSEARGITPAGEIVGFSTAADGQYHAVKWTVR